MAFTALTYGDPAIENATLVALVNLLFGLSFGGAPAANYGWCG